MLGKLNGSTRSDIDNTFLQIFTKQNIFPIYVYVIKGHQSPFILALTIINNCKYL